MTQLGDALSDERRRQGKTLVEVEAATRIRGRMLESLEHGDYDNLPAPAYVKGYIQSYAHYLDVPVQPLLDLYKADLRFADERAAERERLGPVMPRGARYSKASRQNLEDLPADTVVPMREQAHAIPPRTWLVIAGVILAAFAAMWGVSRLFGASTTPPPVPTGVQETTVDGAAPAGDASAAAEATNPAATQTAAVGADEASAATGTSPFTLTFRIRAGETSRLQVVADGTSVYNETVSSGQVPPPIKVYERAEVIIGKPIWVTTFKNGTRIPTPNQYTSYTLTLTNDTAASPQ